MTFYKYNGAGNDFLVADNRDGSLILTERRISEICDRHYGIGADGLMLLGSGRDGADFTMDYYNSDGSGGMMCGNGGRCIAAFADFIGIRPSSADGMLSFTAADGRHRAAILGRNGLGMTVRLKMSDISVAVRYGSLAADSSASGWFIDTGTRHFVRFIDAPADGRYVEEQGRLLRHSSDFAPQGANINFVLPGNPLRVRTFEKGVEAETCACGTGITASAAAAWLEGVAPAWTGVPADSVCGGASVPAGQERRGGDVCPGGVSQSVRYDVLALNDALSVEFTPTREADLLMGTGGGTLPAQAPEGVLCPVQEPDGIVSPVQDPRGVVSPARNCGGPLFTEVWLTGPATPVARVEILDLENNSR